MIGTLFIIPTISGTPISCPARARGAFLRERSGGACDRSILRRFLPSSRDDIVLLRLSCRRLKVGFAMSDEENKGFLRHYYYSWLMDKPWRILSQRIRRNGKKFILQRNKIFRESTRAFYIAHTSAVKYNFA